MSRVAPKRTSEAQTSERPRVVKLTMALPAEAIEDVAELASRSRKTKTQVLREAISLKKFIDDKLEVPDTHVMIKQGGLSREIVFTLAPSR